MEGYLDKKLRNRKKRKTRKEKKVEEEEGEI